MKTIHWKRPYLKTARCGEAGRPVAPLLPPGAACALAAPLRAEVWPDSLVPEWRDLPAGTRCVVVGHADRFDADSGPVMGLPCGGRFVCPPHCAKAVA